MKRFTLFLLLSVLTFSATAQKDPRLLGICFAKDFDREPYAAWYTPGYEGYIPNADIISQLKKTGTEKFTVNMCSNSTQKMKMPKPSLKSLIKPEQG